jgi:peptide/nickel transport system permease protein
MITALAGLSFLGLGVQPPTSDWGSMLASSRQYINVAPHVAAFPGLAIRLMVTRIRRRSRTARWAS